MLAVDQEGIRTALIGEDTSVSGQCQFGVAGSAGYNPGLAEQEYNPDRARELLEEAGAVGSTLTFAVPAARYASGEEIAEVVIDQLEAVGTERRVRPVALPDLAREPLRAPRTAELSCSSCRAAESRRASRMPGTSS